MTDFLASALSQQQILLSNSLATVASECVVVRAENGSSRSIVSLSEIRDLTTVRLSHPGFLVLASAAFLVAAGAHFSKEGDSADWPIALIGLMLLAAYAWSRRAAVCFTSSDERVQTRFGTPADAAAIVAATRSAMTSMYEQAEPESKSLAS